MHDFGRVIHRICLMKPRTTWPVDLVGPLLVLVFTGIAGAEDSCLAFSDTHWTSLNPGMRGANGAVRCLLADGRGNIHVGGQFMRKLRGL